MHWKPAALLLLAIPTPLAAQRRIQELQLVHCFALENALTPKHADPQGWLDADHYLVFDEFEVGDRKIEMWFSVAATDPKQREQLLPPDWIDAFVALGGIRRETIDAALDEADDFHWNEAHTAFVVNFANDLFCFDRTTGVARRLTSTPEEEVGEQFSPDGKLVAYVAGNDLWVVPAAGGDARALTTGGSDDLLHGRLDWIYQEELYGRGDFQAFWWSPDSTRIALLRLDESSVPVFELVSDQPAQPEVEHEHYPKAGDPNPVVDVGVVDVAGGDVRWFDLSRFRFADPLVVRVTWHPSGDEVFYEVCDREQRWLEMMAGDAKSGESRRVFHEDSSCWIEPKFEPVWVGAGDQFLWVSERDGFAQIYRYGRDGTEQGRVTNGEFDVEKMLGVGPDGRFAYFLSDKDDTKQQNLFRVPVEGGEPERLTPEDGWHDPDLAPDDSKFVDDYSRIDYRQLVQIRAVGGDVLSTVVKSDMDLLKRFGIQAPEFLQVPARDGFLLDAMLIKPPDFDPSRQYPVLCFQYSGPHTPRVLNRWMWRDFLWHERMAQKGYVIWVVDPRSASGKGRRSACACFRQFGVTELRDHEDALDWLIGQGFVDPKRVAIWGWSYGGYQTLFNLTHTTKWAAGIAVNPVTDWSLYDSIYTERYMGLPQTNEDGYAKSSVLKAAEDLHGELLLATSTMDDNVHMQNSLRLAWQLEQAGKLFRMVPYPRVKHGMADFRQQMHLFRTMESFLDSTVGRVR